MWQIYCSLEKYKKKHVYSEKLKNLRYLTNFSRTTLFIDTWCTKSESKVDDESQIADLLLWNFWQNFFTSYYENKKLFYGHFLTNGFNFDHDLNLFVCIPLGARRLIFRMHHQEMNRDYEKVRSPEFLR